MVQATPTQARVAGSWLPQGSESCRCGCAGGLQLDALLPEACIEACILQADGIHPPAHPPTPPT